MKTALVCTGLGRTNRGFERFTEELWELVREDLPVTLFGSGGQTHPRRKNFPSIRADGWFSFFKGKGQGPYYWQQLSYAFSFIPFIARNHYNLIHFSEPSLGNFLFHARKRFGLKYKLFFTDGLGLDPARDPNFFERMDLIQALTPIQQDRLVRAGIDSAKIAILPYGVCARDFSKLRDRHALRTRFGIPQDQTVILCVAALNRRHKRIDYLIREISSVKEQVFLVLVGQPEEKDLIQMGGDLLGNNFKFLYVLRHEMPEIYAASDLFVLPSLEEGFCLALVEAMCAGLPVLAHKAPHFEWLIGDLKGLIDMKMDGNLAGKIQEVLRTRAQFRRIARENQVRACERFDWENLKPQYLELYKRAFASI